MNWNDPAKWSDFRPQWKICSHALKGVDIYSLMGGGFHASPWGCLLENLFYGGFLSFEDAKTYFLAMNFTVLLAASFVILTKTRHLEIGKCALISSLLSVDFFNSLRWGNAGGMICAFVIMAWLLCNEHEYISGVLIAFAMIKPQDALIVCILMLVMWKIKPLVIGAVIDISAWGVVSFLTGKGMFELLNEFLFMSKQTWQPPFGGIFTLFADNFYTAMIMSMAAGIIFTVALYMLLPDVTPKIFKAYPAFMAVTFWCYSFSNDRYVLILPICLCLWLMINGRRSMLWLLCSLWCSLGMMIEATIKFLIRFLSSGNFQGNPFDSAYLQAKTLYELVIIIIGILACLELRRIYSESRP